MHHLPLFNCIGLRNSERIAPSRTNDERRRGANPFVTTSSPSASISSSSTRPPSRQRVIRYKIHDVLKENQSLITAFSTFSLAKEKLLYQDRRHRFFLSSDQHTKWGGTSDKNTHSQKTDVRSLESFKNKIIGDHRRFCSSNALTESSLYVPDNRLHAETIITEAPSCLLLELIGLCLPTQDAAEDDLNRRRRMPDLLLFRFLQNLSSFFLSFY